MIVTTFLKADTVGKHLAVKSGPVRQTVEVGPSEAKFDASH